MTEVNTIVNIGELRGTTLPENDLLGLPWLSEHIYEDTRRAFGSLLSYLALGPESQRIIGIERRAGLLNNALKTFSSEGLLQREILIRILCKFIMHTNSDGEGEPPWATINSEVLEHLSDKANSDELRNAAVLLSKLVFDTPSGKIKLFRGTYEVVILGINGEVIAHAFNRIGGGIAHKDLGTLARFALMKSVLGHHCLLALGRHETYPDGTRWHGSTDNRQMFNYFVKKLGLQRIYVGNYDRIGGSGIEMTGEQIKKQAGGYLDERKKYWEFFNAGSADEFGVRIIADIINRRRKGAPLAESYLLPPYLALDLSH